MENQEFLELVQQSVNPLRERTVQQFLEANERYETICQQEEAAEQQYLQLALTAEQRQIVDAMLQEKERSCLLYADATYMAGVKNVLQFRQALEL